MKLDVGGTVFRTLRSTVERYPQSLLAKMINEFPNLVESGQTLYVDRSPKAFEWILEIYRTGDCTKTMPCMPPEELQNELDFYQLPTAINMNVNLKTNIPLSKAAYARDLAARIDLEIRVCGMQAFFPWKVYVYHKYQGGVTDRVPSVFVVPPSGMDDMSYVALRGHSEFDKVRLDKRRTNRHLAYNKLSVRFRDSDAGFVLRVMDHEFLKNFTNEMAQRNLRYRTEKDIKMFGWAEDCSLQYLVVDCIR